MEQRIDDVAAEKAHIRSFDISSEGRERYIAWLDWCVREAERAGGWVKKIVWDREGGYPEHAWGYTQYTVRPYRQGYGCDGTTDGNIHFIAAHISHALGLDYAAIYAEAYPDMTLPESRKMIAEILGDSVVVAETELPGELSYEVINNACNDLYAINNRSLEDLLRDRLIDALRHREHEAPPPA